jgi:hypothetical protein
VPKPLGLSPNVELERVETLGFPSFSYITMIFVEPM